MIELTDKHPRPRGRLAVVAPVPLSQPPGKATVGQPLMPSRGISRTDWLLLRKERKPSGRTNLVTLKSKVKIRIRLPSKAKAVWLLHVLVIS